MKKLIVNTKYCIACGLCDIHCATIHSKYPSSVLKAYRLSVTKPLSALYIEKNADLNHSIQCFHCEDAPCVAACISGAMYKDENTSYVLVNKDKCVACYTCIAACPWGLIKKSNALTGGIIKCDRCHNLADEPVCASNCPNGALLYIDEIDEEVLS